MKDSELKSIHRYTRLFSGTLEQKRLLVGNHAIMYAVSAGWISVGNLWMFGGLLLTMKKVQNTV